VLFGSCNLDGLHGAEDLADGAGDAPGGLAAGGAVLFQAFADGLHDGDHAYQGQEDQKGYFHADGQ